MRRLFVVLILFLPVMPCAGLVGAFLADRTPPLNVTAIEVLTPTVRPGGQLMIKFRVTRFRSCRDACDRVLMDGAGHRDILKEVDFLGTPAQLLGDSIFITTIDVPENFEPGPGVYVTLSQYRCNLVHQLWPINMPAREIGFTIAG